MKIATLLALLGTAACVEVTNLATLSEADDDTGDKDENDLSQLMSSALAGAKPGIINEPVGKGTDKELDKQVTSGKAKNYKFHWQYACAFTKWIPSNQFMHAGKAYDAKSMTLERFGFIGMDKKCFWGMIGVEWITPLKIV